MIRRQTGNFRAMRYAIIHFLLLWHYGLPAQLNGKYTFRHLDQTDGLLHTTIRGIGQDQRGFIWILSLGGLQRFDGSRFLNYPDITRHSSFGVIHDSELYVDTVSNSVRIIKGRSVQILDLATNTFSSIPLTSCIEDNPLFPLAKFTDADHEDWRISEAGVMRAIGPEIYTSHNHHPGEAFRNNLVVKDPGTGNFWTHGFDRIVIARHRSGLIISSADPEPEDPLLSQLKERSGADIRFRYLLLDSHHNLWITTWQKELFRYNRDQQVLTSYSLTAIKNRGEAPAQSTANVLVTSMYEDRQGKLWIGTEYAGLLCYNRASDDFERITADDKIQSGLTYNFNINAIFQDRDENIWIGTDRGISIFNPGQNHIQTIRHIEGNTSSLSKHDINDVIETSQGEILVATWGGGITCFDKHWNYKRQLRFEGPEAQNQVWCFEERDDGVILAGAQQGYIHLYDPIHQTVKTIRPPETENSTISTMVKDSVGNILLGLFSGHIITWDQYADKFIKSTSALSNPITGLTYLSAGPGRTCWGASAKGLVEFDMDAHRVTNVYTPDSTDAHTGVTMEGIEQYNDSILLVGTIYRGLYLFNVNTKLFSRPEVIDLAGNNSVWAIKK
jgi:ligand-binding sensor domain-containing protein